MNVDLNDEESDRLWDILEVDLTAMKIHIIIRKKLQVYHNHQLSPQKEIRMVIKLQLSKTNNVYQTTV